MFIISGSANLLFCDGVCTEALSSPGGFLSVCMELPAENWLKGSCLPRGLSSYSHYRGTSSVFCGSLFPSKAHLKDHSNVVIMCSHALSLLLLLWRKLWPLGSALYLLLLLAHCNAKTGDSGTGMEPSCLTYPSLTPMRVLRVLGEGLHYQ